MFFINKVVSVMCNECRFLYLDEVGELLFNIFMGPRLFMKLYDFFQ